MFPQNQHTNQRPLAQERNATRIDAQAAEEEALLRGLAACH